MHCEPLIAIIRGFVAIVVMNFADQFLFAPSVVRNLKGSVRPVTRRCTAFDVPDVAESSEQRRALDERTTQLPAGSEDHQPVDQRQRRTRPQPRSLEAWTKEAAGEGRDTRP